MYMYYKHWQVYRYTTHVHQLILQDVCDVIY